MNIFKNYMNLKNWSSGQDMSKSNLRSYSLPISLLPLGFTKDKKPKMVMRLS